MQSTSDLETKDMTQVYLEWIQTFLKTFTSIYQQYFSDSESFQSKLEKSTKILQSSINPSESEQLPSLLININNFFQTYQKLLKENTKQIQHVYQVQVDDFNGVQKKLKSQIQDQVSQIQKSVNQANKNYNSTKSKYDKICKETEQTILEKQNSQNDIQFYSVLMQQKTTQKIKDGIKEKDQIEVQLKKEIDDVNQANQQSFSQVKDNYQSIKQVFKKELSLFLNIVITHTQKMNTMLQTITNLMNEAKLNNIDFDLSLPSIEDNKTLNTNIKAIPFINIMNKINKEQQLTPKEAQSFPEVLGNYFEVFNEMNDDRKKNVKALIKFFTELASSLLIVKSAKEQIKSKLQSCGLSKKGTLVMDLIMDQSEYIFKIQQDLVASIKDRTQLIENEINNLHLQEKGIQNLTDSMLADFKKLDPKQFNQKIFASVQILKFSMDDYRTHENKRLENLRKNILQIMIEYQQSCEKQIKKNQELFENFKLKTELIDEEIRYAFSEEEANLMNNENANFVNRLSFQNQFNLQNLNYQKFLQEEVKEQLIDETNSEDMAIPSISSPQRNDSKEGSQDKESQVKEGSGKKVSKFLSTCFNVGENEHCIDSFTCAIQLGILLQGRLYIYKDKLCFHSYFNDKNILIGPTVFVIPIEDIKSFEKKVKALIFDSALSVQTVKGEVIFASFVQRDHCLTKLQNLKSNNEDQEENKTNLVKSDESLKDEIESKQSQSQQNEQSQIKYSDEFSGNQSQIRSQKSSDDIQVNNDYQIKMNEQQIPQQNIQQQPISNQNILTWNKIKEVYNKQKLMTKDREFFIQKTLLKDVSPREIFINFFGSTVNFQKNNTTYPSFLRYYLQEIQKDTDITIGQFNPKLPGYLLDIQNQDIEELNKHQDYYLREIGYTHPVKEKMGPKDCRIDIKEKTYFLSENEFYIDREVYVSKAPMSDVFVTFNTFKFKKQGNDCVFEFAFFINFVKSSWFKGIIQAANEKNNKEFWDVFSKMLSEECAKIVQKRKNDPVQQQPQPVQQIQQEIQQVIQRVEINQQQPVVLPEIQPEINVEDNSQTIKLIKEIQEKLDLQFQQNTEMRYMIIGLVILNIIILIFK